MQPAKPPHAQCRAGGLSGVLQQLQGYFPEDAGNSKEPTLPPPEFAERLKRKTKMPGRFPTERTVPNGPRRKSRDHSRPLQKSLLLHQIQIEPHEDACGLCSDGRAGGVNGAVVVKSFLSGNPNFWHEACELLILLLRKFGFPMVSPAVID